MARTPYFYGVWAFLISHRLSLPSRIQVPPSDRIVSLIGPHRSPRNFFGLTRVASSPSSMFRRLASTPADLSFSVKLEGGQASVSSSTASTCWVMAVAFPTERIIPIFEPQSGQVSQITFDSSLLKRLSRLSKLIVLLNPLPIMIGIFSVVKNYFNSMYYNYPEGLL